MKKDFNVMLYDRKDLQKFRTITDEKSMGGLKMYITKYWGDYIGGTDDSLNLMEYLAGKQKEEIPLGEIISDTGLDRLHGAFQTTDSPLGFANSEGLELEFQYAIDLLTDLAALLLECKVSGSVNLYDLDRLCGVPSLDTIASDCIVRITAAPEEHELMNQALKDFVSAPLDYDLSEMVPEEDMMEMAATCEELRKELYEL